jgi:hypothetical protein
MGAHIVFADESGFQLMPNVVRTWAPQGQTPIHRHRQGRRDKISVISGISVSPKRHHLGLYYLLFLANIGQEEVGRFLQELLRHLGGPVIVLLDNSSTHQGKPLQKLLDRHPRLHLEHFPSYAPELNPAVPRSIRLSRRAASGSAMTARSNLPSRLRRCLRIRPSALISG